LAEATLVEAGHGRRLLSGSMASNCRRPYDLWISESEVLGDLSTALGRARLSSHASFRHKCMSCQTADIASARDSKPERTSRIMKCPAPSLRTLTLGPVSVRKPAWFRGERRALRHIPAGAKNGLFAGPFPPGGAARLLLAMQKVEGSNPFSRSRKGLLLQVFFLGPVG
jgi:hypothetical protein